MTNATPAIDKGTKVTGTYHNVPFSGTVNHVHYGWAYDTYHVTLDTAITVYGEKRTSIAVANDGMSTQYTTIKAA